MPFTPFHFGPAVLVKSVLPRAFSLSVFVATQVVIDVETLYHLIRHDWPVHTVLHSLLGGTVVGVGVGAVGCLAGLLLADPATHGGREEGPVAQTLRAELSPIGSLLGGVVGGASHSVLDGIVHADVRPYWPFSAAHGWPGVLRPGTLDLVCVVAGLLGSGILWLTLRRRRLPV